MPNNLSADIAVMMMTYNSEQDIEGSLKAIAAQTYKGFHVVYVDDCSTDGTYEIAQAMANMLPSASIKRNTANKGVLKNLYDTLQMVEDQVPNASFYVWACADDLWAPSFLEKTREHLLANPDTMICQTWFDTFHETTRHTTVQKLNTINGRSYADASRLFKRVNTEEGTATYNFALHGLMRFPMMRTLYPDNLKKIANSASTELSGLALVLSHGHIYILQNTLIHRKENGRFADKNPQDSLSRYYSNIPLRAAAVMGQLPHMLASKGKSMSLSTIFLMWLHTLLFYVVAPARGYIKRLITQPFSKV